MITKNTPVVFLMGATATGKNTLAYQLYQQLPVCIINVDSVQFYRHFSIGSAKPDAIKQKKYDIRMIDICNPDYVYTVGRFCRDVQVEIHKARKNGLLPLLIGGSMMYFRALTQGLAVMPESCPEIKRQLLDNLKMYGVEHLFLQLQKIDPVIAGKISANDSQRIIRALEVYKISGKKLSDLHKHSTPIMTNVCPIALSGLSRQQLHQRIEDRFLQMLDAGFVEEVNNLRKQWPQALELPVFRSVGYRQVLAYLEGECDYQTMVANGISATRQLAKRQITWLRSWPDAYHITTNNKTEMVSKIIARIVR